MRARTTGVAGPTSKWLWWQGQYLPSLDGPDGAALVGAHRVERLEGAGRRLGDDGLAVGEDLAAPDRDLGRRGAAAGPATPRPTTGRAIGLLQAARARRRRRRRRP